VECESQQLLPQSGCAINWPASLCPTSTPVARFCIFGTLEHGKMTLYFSKWPKEVKLYAMMKMSIAEQFIYLLTAYQFLKKEKHYKIGAFKVG
jgi:hypothetical protein